MKKLLLSLLFIASVAYAVAQTNTFPSSGSVGIGTTTPSARLDIESSILLDWASNNSWGVAIKTPPLVGGWSRGFNFRSSTGGELAMFGAYGTNDVLNYAYIAQGANYYATPWMAFYPNGNVGIGSLDAEARLQLYKENTLSRTSVQDLLYLSTTHASVGYTGFGTGIVDFRRTYQNATPHAINRISFIELGNSIEDVGGAITFETKRYSSGVNAPIERMRINHLGNMGIGTNSPRTKLHIFSESESEALRLHTLYHSNGIQRAALTWHDGSGYTGSIDTRYNGATVDMVFGSLYSQGYNTNELMRLTGAGNLGIGTIAPENRLTVNGSLGIAAYSKIGSGQGYGCTGCASAGFIELYNGTTGNMTLQSGNSFKLLLNPLGGNVGIGTTTPNGNHFSSSAQNVLNIAGNLPVLQFNDVDNNKASYVGMSANTLYVGGSGGVGLQLQTNGAPVMHLGVSGNVGIGIENPTTKLAVNGVIQATKLKVTQTPWADFVFNKGYKLRTLESLEEFILQNKHLPGVPSESEVKRNGVDIADTQVLLLQKIEELTLYAIQQYKDNSELRARIEKLEKKIQLIQKR